MVNQRKVQQNRLCPTLTRTERKERLLKREQYRERGLAGGQFYWDRLQRQNKIDTSEGKRNQRMRWSLRNRLPELI